MRLTAVPAALVEPEVAAADTVGAGFLESSVSWPRGGVHVDVTPRCSEPSASLLVSLVQPLAKTAGSRITHHDWRPCCTGAGNWRRISDAVGA